MNAPADLDLSGRWTGMFNYPGPFPPVGFEAELRDQGGSITGTVLISVIFRASRRYFGTAAVMPRSI